MFRTDPFAVGDFLGWHRGSTVDAKTVEFSFRQGVHFCPLFKISQLAYSCDRKVRRFLEGRKQMGEIK